MVISNFNLDGAHLLPFFSAKSQMRVLSDIQRYGCFTSCRAASPPSQQGIHQLKVGKRAPP